MSRKGDPFTNVCRHGVNNHNNFGTIKKERHLRGIKQEKNKLSQATQYQCNTINPQNINKISRKRRVSKKKIKPNV